MCGYIDSIFWGIWHMFAKRNQAVDERERDSKSNRLHVHDLMLYLFILNVTL